MYIYPHTNTIWQTLSFTHGGIYICAYSINNFYNSCGDDKKTMIFLWKDHTILEFLNNCQGDVAQSICKEAENCIDEDSQ